MSKTIIHLLKLYKSASSFIWKFRPIPIVYSDCKFNPTCSEYAQEAVSRHGVIKGLAKAGLRILRCNPFTHGGYDPVK